MTRLLQTAVIFPLFIICFAIFTACGRPPEVLVAVPLCDCLHNPDDARSDCWEGYVCDDDTACSHNGGLYDKCIPQNAVRPHDHQYEYTY